MWGYLGQNQEVVDLSHGHNIPISMNNRGRYNHKILIERFCSTI